MKQFEFYIQNKDVRKISPDFALASSLVKDMFNRTNMVLTLDLKKFAKIIFENIYDALRDFCDALLIVDGYKSYSHEASISYLKNYNFSEEDITKLDNFRYIRNGSKYYGKDISIQDAKEIKKFYLKNINKIKKNIREKIKE